LQKQLNTAGIGSLIHYPIPPHLQQAYSSYGYVKGSFPIAENIANNCLSIPMGPHLELSQVERISMELITFFQNKVVS
jgi:dTDP-4-amino-4,6-dideoxygalactose transaminase